ncbi:MAG: hypothetical protein RRB13_12710 [bacterium]|nr:hypothetical protein [bacterium]
MAKPLRWILPLFISCLLGSPLWAADIKDAVADMAEELRAKPKIAKHAERAIIIQVVNLHNQKTDQTAKKIETELYLALERSFPEFRLVFLSEALNGVNLIKALVVKGQYEQKGESTTLRIAALNGLNGEVIAQAEGVFETEKTRQESLVAVLDIEAEYLTRDQTKAYSDLFRAALASTHAIKLASSADVDKMDPDQVQKAYGCTRDECATIIGEQLGVDRVISTSLFKLSESKYMLSSKVMDIQNGAILTSKTVRHNGNLASLDLALETLAHELTGTKAANAAAAEAPTLRSSERQSGGVFWHLVATGGALGAAVLSVNTASQYNTLATDQQDLKTQYDASSSTTERSTLKTKYDSNASQMTSLKQQVQTYDALTVVFALWEGYLLFSGPSAVAAGAPPARQWQFALMPGVEKPSLHLNWSF